MSAEAPPTPDRVPMLTEVVRDAPMAFGPASLGAAIEEPRCSDTLAGSVESGLPQPRSGPDPDLVLNIAPHVSATVDTARIVEDVLAELQHRIDPMLEYRLRDALAPALARAADVLVEQARVELAQTLREIVAGAVAQEVARPRGD